MDNVTTDINTIGDAGLDKYLNRPSIGAWGGDRYIKAQNIAGGKLSSNTVIELGGGFVKIDGKNKRIIISDGTTDRVLIGYQQNGF